MTQQCYRYALLAGLVFATACGGTGTDSPPAPVAAVTVSLANPTIELGSGTTDPDRANNTSRERSILDPNACP